MAARFRAFLQKHPRIDRSLTLVAWLPVVIFINQHVAGVIAIEGRSMQPTFNPDASFMHEDVVLVNRWVRSTQKYRIGDIITFWAPGVNKSVLVTKRIVALQGDVVRTLPPWKDRMVRVPPGHAWVEGDEPNRSRDSNTFGPLPLGLVNGKIEAILWPHWRFSWTNRILPEAAQKRVIHHRDNIDVLPVR